MNRMSARRPRLLLLNDNSAHPNWGAQATPYSIRRMLADHFAEAEVNSLPYSWLAARYRELRIPFARRVSFTEKHFGVLNPFIYRASQQIDPYPEIFDDFEYYGDQWVAGEAGPVAADFIERLKWCDALVHNGENSLYRNTVPGMRSLFLLWLAKTRYGKVAAEINHTASLAAMTRPIMSGMARGVLPLLDLVTAREVHSLADLRKLGVENAEVYPDVVFYLGAEFGPEGSGIPTKLLPRINAPYFCLSASALPMSAPRNGSTGAVMELVQRVKDQLGLTPVLLARDAHCQFLRVVSERTGGVFFGPDHGFPELWPLLQRARFVITGHYHYAIIAAQVGCPFIPLSTNNHKMSGVAEHLGWHLREPFDATAIRPVIEQIVAEAERLHANRDVYSRALEQRARQMKDESAQHVVRLREILAARTTNQYASAVNA
jgi:polysaccharide pyruvyl transferase